MLSADKVQKLKDTNFELRCAAEDIATGLAEGASAEELKALCTELVQLSLSVERIV